MSKRVEHLSLEDICSTYTRVSRSGGVNYKSIKLLILPLVEVMRQQSWLLCVKLAELRFVIALDQEL